MITRPVCLSERCERRALLRPLAMCHRWLQALWRLGHGASQAQQDTVHLVGCCLSRPPDEEDTHTRKEFRGQFLGNCSPTTMDTTSETLDHLGWTPHWRPSPPDPAPPGKSGLKKALLLGGLLLALVAAFLSGGAVFGWLPASASVLWSDQTTPPLHLPVTSLVQDVPQYLPTGYDSQAQFEEWQGYTCGAATMTAILHAYGAKTRIGIIFDLLHYPVFGINDLDQQGLHGPDGFVPLLQQYYSSWYAVPFNGKTTGYLGYAHLQRIVQAGYPVAADFWNDGSFWPDLSEGHWMTVVGFTATNVIVRDSSTFHLDNKLSIALFKQLYTGIAAPVLPVGVALP